MDGIKNFGAVAKRANIVNAVINLIHGCNLNCRLTGLDIGTGLNIT